MYNDEADVVENNENKIIKNNNEYGDDTNDVVMNTYPTHRHLLSLCTLTNDDHGGACIKEQ